MKKQSTNRPGMILLGYVMIVWGLFQGYRTLFDPAFLPDIKPSIPIEAMTAEEFIKLSSTNLNTADRQELMELPGIGEVLSQRILDYRAENGGFTAVEGLVNVKGIGEKTLEKLRKYVYVE